jgi:hypothetical protein
MPWRSRSIFFGAGDSPLLFPGQGKSLRQALLHELGSFIGVCAAEALRHVLRTVLRLVVQPHASHSAPDSFPCAHEERPVEMTLARAGSPP